MNVLVPSVPINCQNCAESGNILSKCSFCQFCKSLKFLNAFDETNHNKIFLLELFISGGVAALWAATILSYTNMLDV